MVPQGAAIAEKTVPKLFLAMSFQVDTALIQTYHSNIDIKFQQMGSRLRSAVRNEVQHAEFDYYDRVTPTAAVEVVTRHGDTPLISTPHDRRRVGLRDFDWADLIDRKDKLRMLADPTSPYTTNAVYALGRAQDQVLISAAFGSASTGKTGSTTVAFPTTQYMYANAVETTAPAANYLGGTSDSSGFNLTLGKLRIVRKAFDVAEVTTDSQADLYIAVSPAAMWALMRDSISGPPGGATYPVPNPVVSGDYNAVRALINGELQSFLGFRFIKSNLLPIQTGTVRSCIAWEKQGLVLASGSEINVDVGPRRDKRNSIQIYVSGSFGAVRLWEEKVVKVNCEETA
jgi:hypothetical protein